MPAAVQGLVDNVVAAADRARVEQEAAFNKRKRIP
jgi:hypothetical protein